MSGVITDSDLSDEPKMATVGQKTGEDEDEWSQIAEIMESFGACIARESVFVRDFEAEFTKHLATGPQRIKTVGDWLTSLGLPQYENTLIANGFDDLDFVGVGVLDDSDLEQIGVKENQHRDLIIESHKSLPTVIPLDPNNLPLTVEMWLESLRLSEYIHTFTTHSYTDMQRVVHLWELELSSVLDITPLGHRKRILASLGDRTKHTQLDSPLPSRKPQLDLVDWTTPLPEPPESPIDSLNFFKDYTQVRSLNRTLSEPHTPTKVAPTPPPKTNRPKGMERSLSGRHLQDDTIHIRPPKTGSRGAVKHWRHQPQKLIKGCCNYSSHYLGSTLVKELNGVDSTREGILKMKKSKDALSKVPKIILSISYKGVKFIDAKSKRVVCEHEITNIFCGCQDQNDLAYFAYITKDLLTGKNYCHTFSAHNTDLAQEIILTLGEAFEIAYQMALKERAERSAQEFDDQLNGSGADDESQYYSSVDTLH